MALTVVPNLSEMRYTVSLSLTTYVPGLVGAGVGVTVESVEVAVDGITVAPDGMINVCPTKMVNPVNPFAVWIACTVVPYRIAMRKRLSPGCTTCVVPCADAA